MTKYYSHNLIYILLLVWVFIDACNNTSSQNEKINASKPSAEITQTPPPLVSQSTSDNELEDALANVDYSPLVTGIIRSIFQDSKGNLWFGQAGESVARYDGKILKYYSKIEFFHGNNSVGDGGSSIHAIVEDKKGNIWFGTGYGAVKYDGKNFRSYTEKDGLSNTMISRKSILIDKPGNIWVGTQDGVFRYNPSADSIGGKCFLRFYLLPCITVKDIMEDKTGNIWFASQDNGVFRYDGKAIKNITNKAGLGDNYVGGMAQDKTGNFWFTMKGGICRYDGKTFTEFTTKDGLGGSEVQGIYMEKSGIIWIVAGGRTTTRYDPSIPISNPKAFTVFTEQDGLCCVQSMYQDRSGNMWWGTGQGPYRFDGKRFYQVKENGPW
jgi:ligand-binding sensor domain-containing protein